MEVHDEELSREDKLEKQKELEKIELEIRESQHKQNLKLMDIMLKLINLNY